MTTTMLALAAGMGSRFGGPKQLEPLGPAGETILDFSIHDAWRAGFDKVVLVIRRELREAFESSIVPRWRDRIAVALVEQSVDDLPPGFTRPPDRTRPWGTGQAILAARHEVEGRFAVVNADDFYGATAYRMLHEFFSTGPDARTWANVGYPLRDTLTGSGGVNRALLRVGASGWLEQIEEIIDIEKVGDDGRYTARDGEPRTIPGDALVSMNIWGFDQPLFDELDTGFRRFLAAHIAEPKSELVLPNFVQELVGDGRARVRVLRGTGPWAGVTHPEDKPSVAAVLRDLVERGEYPTPLWG